MIQIKKVKIIKELYAFVKEISLEFYSEDRHEFVCLENLVQLLSWCENTLEDEYIVDTSTNYNENISNKSSNAESIVSEIVHLTRKSLLQLFTKYGRPHSFDFYNVENYCETSCDLTSSICNDMSIKNHKIKMQNGFANNMALFNGKGYHCFSILEIKDKKYLVDGTYKQFFLLKRCLLERIGIPYLGGCYAGGFMIMSESRRQVAEKLLKDGWILLTEEVFKDYMDGFFLSWRNGLYYEETDDFSYKTSYTAKDYWNFLMEQDNILRYEKELTLGFQKMPLKNPNISFRKN